MPMVIGWPASLSPIYLLLMLHSFMLLLHGLFLGFGANFAFFAIILRRHAALFHFTHAHLAHTVFTAFAFAGFAALTAFSILATLAFFTTRHFHVHARL
jgi:hypothetical protein